MGCGGQEKGGGGGTKPGVKQKDKMIAVEQKRELDKAG